MLNPYDLSDADCVLALHAIDENLEINLTDWEADFVGNNLQRNRFSEKQKEVIAKIIDKHRVKYK
jgi:hypothetical protein